MSGAGATDDAPSILRLRDFRQYLIGRGLGNLSYRMIMVAAGWQLYELTNSPLALGYLGLALFLPAAALLLPAGELADRYDRRTILRLSYGALALCTATLCVMTLADIREPFFYYAVLTVLGGAQAVTRPADTSFIPFLVPREQLPRGVAWTASCQQLVTVIGPLLGGKLLEYGVAEVYGVGVVFYLVTVALYASLRVKPATASAAQRSAPLERLREELVYVSRRPIILGAITLDLFAVLLGGAVVLLPIFARDILDIGPEGLGWLRGSQALGAVVMALILTRFPLGRRAGLKMFAAVAVFGAFTILFGVSTSTPLSIFALFMLGAVNMVSFNFRHTVIQMATPDDMRGRVSAVHSICTGTSNELGDFESGVTAEWFGAAPAVVLGGAGTIAVVGLWMWMFPDLRRVDRMSDVKPI